MMKLCSKILFGPDTVVARVPACVACHEAVNPDVIAFEKMAVIGSREQDTKLLLLDSTWLIGTAWIIAAGGLNLGFLDHVLRKFDMLVPAAITSTLRFLHMPAV